MSDCIKPPFVNISCSLDMSQLGINGKPLPSDHEVQEMEFLISEPSSPGGSTPWGSEKQSEASEPPDLG